MSTHPAPEIQIEKLTSVEQYRHCVGIQLEVWGYEETDIIPARMFQVASAIGGQVLGAFAAERMVGFAMALPGYRSGHSYLHSHMLGVLTEFRNLGVGQKLKLAQRDDALARGIQLMEWTFDPLEIKNAHLNIAKLGAIARRYKRNIYGASTSPLQGGLPTDRLYAEWWLASERVQRVLAGEPTGAEVREHVDVPAAIYQWKASPEHREEARQVQAINAGELEAAFDRGLSVIGYERRASGDGRFLLGVFNEDLKY